MPGPVALPLPMGSRAAKGRPALELWGCGVLIPGSSAMVGCNGTPAVLYPACHFHQPPSWMTQSDVRDVCLPCLLTASWEHQGQP